MQIFKEINERQILAHKRWLCVYLLERLFLRWEDIFHHYHHKLCCSTAQKKKPKPSAYASCLVQTSKEWLLVGIQNRLFA